MKRAVSYLSLALLLTAPSFSVRADESRDAEKELREAKEVMQNSGTQKNIAEAMSAPKKVKPHTRAEAFVAGPDWEFDGFVSGGQDSQIKSMYIINDLIYLNIGRNQGVEPGTILSIYRRGSKVRDAQNRKFLGYEVRRAAIGEVTDKVEDKVCAARIIQTYEGVEVGDLVRIDK